MGKTCPWDTCCNWTKPRPIDAKLDGIERRSIEETKDYCGIVSVVQPLEGFIPINSFALQPGGVCVGGGGGGRGRSLEVLEYPFSYVFVKK